MGGAFGLFQFKRICLRAMREANATTSEFFLVRLVGLRGTPKIDISGQGSNLILRALFNDLKKHDQKLTSLGQEKNIWTWSAGDKPHLSQISFVPGNSLLFLLFLYIC